MVVETNSSGQSSVNEVDSFWGTNDGNRSAYIRWLETKARVDARFRHQPIIRNGSTDYTPDDVETVTTTLDGSHRNMRMVKPERFLQYVQFREEDDGIQTEQLPGVEYARERPQWLKRIAETLVAMQERAILEPENPLTFVNQVKDPLALMAGPLKFASVEDVDLWNLFRESLRHVTWNISMSSSDENYTENNAVEFSNEMSELVDLGIDPEIITTWFEGIESVFSVPGLHQKYLSEHGYFNGVVTADKTGEALNGYTMHPAPNLSLQFDVTRPYKRIQLFAQHVESLLSVEERFADVAEQAGRVSRIAERLLENGYPEAVTSRPNSFKAIIDLIANGVEKKVATDGEDADPQEIANAVVRFLRKNHVVFDMQEIIGVCAAFSTHSDINHDSLAVAASYAESGYPAMSFLSNKSVDELSDAREFISNQVVPEIILQIRKENLQTFNFERVIYESIGLDRQVWRDHESKLQEVHRSRFTDFLEDREETRIQAIQTQLEYYHEIVGETKDNSIVDDGDVVIRVSMTGNPVTYSHMELVHDLTNLSREELIQAGFVDKDFEGKVVVAVEVNNNPEKEDTHGKLLLRWLLARDSFIGENVYVLPIVVDDESGSARGYYLGPTFERIEAEKEDLRSAGKSVTMARSCGAEKLDHTGKYDPVREKSANLGNRYRHVWFGDSIVNNWPRAHEQMKSILSNFPGSIVCLSPVVDHGTNIRPVIASADSRLRSIYVAQ